MNARLSPDQRAALLQSAMTLDEEIDIRHGDFGLPHKTGRGAGAIARLVIPGKQNLSILMTIVIGIVGSFVGGLLGYLIFGKDLTDGALQPSGIIGSVIGAIIVMFVVTRTGLVGKRTSS